MRLTTHMFYFQILCSLGLMKKSATRSIKSLLADIIQPRDCGIRLLSKEVTQITLFVFLREHHSQFSVFDIPLIQLACELLLVLVNIGLDTLGIGILIRRIDGPGVAKSYKGAKVTVFFS